jgi:hypothetical protein
MKRITTLFLLASALLMVAWSHRDNVSYKDDVKKALEQADLKDVTVSEDQDKNTITLGGSFERRKGQSRRRSQDGCEYSDHSERDQC